MMTPVDELMEEILKENSWRFAEAVKDEIIEQIVEVVLNELGISGCRVMLIERITAQVKKARAKCR